ncbi:MULTISPECIES: YjcQ family protein [Paenibacillus]|nr:YjcQ family protein [Paenibacillus vini]MDN4069718.1 YjcQ family protein [Paenibacillus vini]
MNKDKLRFAILKEINEGNTPLTEEDFGVSEDEFDNAVNYLSREDYIAGVFWADNRPLLLKIGPVITDKGEQYLKDNSMWGKAYKGLIEIRDWLK